ncbi:MAG: hypothetical protein NC417_05085 [Candidatus Gastranaerophilales bacterium]|nr:hypothetical protein [Candidatus Gastranaerophilales bacterium]
MDEALRKEFRMPGADKRSIPFWAWNAKLDEEELRCQVRQMKEAGVGGFFIHSREGLETDYLGEQWMNCVKAVVQEAKVQGIYAWLYDEDRWPSGTAGGRVTSCGDAYRCKGLAMEILPAAAYGELYEKEIRPKKTSGDEAVGILAVYGAKICGDSLVSYRRLEMGEEEPFGDNEVVLAVRLEVSAPSEWFNNEAPPDNLNPDCVRKFIRETHEKYRKAVGEEFGKTIRGIFTDEPSLNDRFSYFGEKKSWIPWTYGYGAFFKERMGYDFLDVLPLFYFHGENSPEIRHDYWCSIAQRYGESYFKTLGEWCEENRLLFTGHFLQEDKLGLSTRVNGAVMPHYQYMHVPGIDMLCEQTNEYMTVKQCTSVARQLGKKHVITETYGCTGWDFTFEGQKWMGDWQYVLGVNRRCQHLMHYSLRGCRKRDYPPCFNYNTTWWRENRIVDDYFARLSAVLEQGDAVRDILLLHPVSTAWSRLGVNPYGNPKRRGERDVPAINEYGERFNGLIEYLMRRHLDCDLGDELIIQKYGRIDSGKFVIGEAAYRAVVLPPMDTMLLSTAEKLLEYMEQGGFIYAMTPCAHLVGASREHRDILEKLETHRNWRTVDSREELAKSLEPYRRIHVENVDGEECGDVLCQLRKKGEEYYLFLVNNSRGRTADVTVKLGFHAEIMRMDLLSGEVTEVSCGNDVEGAAGMQVHLEKTGSALFGLREKKTEILQYEGPFSYRLNRGNVLTLDRCRYRMNGDEWLGEMEVWQAQKEIREALKMRPVYRNGIEQRYKWIDKPHPGNGTPVELIFRFTSHLPISGAAVALERPEEFRIFLNGEEILREMDGWFLDKEIQKWKLPEIVQGENELLLICEYRNDMELENIYLTGAFGVDAQRCLTALPEKLCAGNWTEHGLRHYCGNVIYQVEYRREEISDGEKVWLRLPPTEGICVKVRVNGSETILPWNFERRISIEKWLRPGENTIEAEVVGSPRNMMGPFHLKEKPASTSAASFCPSAEVYSEDYLLAPYGLMGAIEIIREL